MIPFDLIFLKKFYDNQLITIACHSCNYGWSCQLTKVIQWSISNLFFLGNAIIVITILHEVVAILHEVAWSLRVGGGFSGNMN